MAHAVSRVTRRRTGKQLQGGAMSAMVEHPLPFISLLLVCYTYLGYPVLVWALSHIRPRAVRGSTGGPPTVSVVLAVHNGSATLRARLENLLAQAYPGGIREIIVVSDGSTDDSAVIAGEYAERGVLLLEIPGRIGKAQAVNRGVALARGELVVFADVRQRFEAGAVAALAADFSDPRVGCVSGELILLKGAPGGIQGPVRDYWQYEKWIRSAESSSGSMVGATGAIYAIRRSLYAPLPPGTILDDVLTPLRIACLGYRCLFERKARAYDLPSTTLPQEWRRKVRTLAGNWQLLQLEPRLLSPWHNPCWWRFISHKLLRLLVPYALAALLATLLIGSAEVLGLVREQGHLLPRELSFFWGVVTGGLLARGSFLNLVRLGYSFLALNLAAVAGFYYWISGNCATVWRTEK